MVLYVAKSSFSQDVAHISFPAEADCAMTDLGYVAYHGSLTLEELMQEDPAEQYRQEMGGLT